MNSQSYVLIFLVCHLHIFYNYFPIYNKNKLVDQKKFILQKIKYRPLSPTTILDTIKLPKLSLLLMDPMVISFL